MQFWHLEQLANDYTFLWLEAESDEEKVQVWRDYKAELDLAFLVPFGVHLGQIALAQALFKLGVLTTDFLLFAGILWLFMRRIMS